MTGLCRQRDHKQMHFSLFFLFLEAPCPSAPPPFLISSCRRAHLQAAPLAQQAQHDGGDLAASLEKDSGRWHGGSGGNGFFRQLCRAAVVLGLPLHRLRGNVHEHACMCLCACACACVRSRVTLSLLWVCVHALSCACTAFVSVSTAVDGAHVGAKSKTSARKKHCTCVSASEPPIPGS